MFVCHTIRRFSATEKCLLRSLPKFFRKELQSLRIFPSKTNLENAPVVLREAYERLKALPTWDNTSIHDCLINMAVEKELKNGTVMWPVRIAAAGKTVTPGGAVEILDILGREESLKRLEIGLEKLGA